MTLVYETAASGAKIAVITECPFCGKGMDADRGQELSQHLYAEHTWDDVTPDN